MPKEILISEASEARTMAESLIPQYHPHLLDARIMYLFTTAKRMKCDRVKLGSAKKFSAMERYLSSRHFIGTRDPAIELGADFLILIDIEEWQLLTPEQRLALVDHECCHCWRAEKIVKNQLIGYWTIRGHSVEEFTEILGRHGFWRQELASMGEVVQQLHLPLPR